jgi:uncharacterized membrane protein YcaP (DUF421 family)
LSIRRSRYGNGPRAAAIYLILLIIFKIAGRRTLMQLTNFDLILLLIISEATQQAMLSTDYSLPGRC